MITLTYCLTDTLLYDESHDRDEYLKSKTMITKVDFVPGRKAGVFISNKDKMVDELFKFLSDTTQLVLLLIVV